MIAQHVDSIRVNLARHPKRMNLDVDGWAGAAAPRNVAIKSQPLYFGIVKRRPGAEHSHKQFGSWYFGSFVHASMVVRLGDACEVVGRCATAFRVDSWRTALLLFLLLRAGFLQLLHNDRNVAVA